MNGLNKEIVGMIHVVLDHARALCACHRASILYYCLFVVEGFSFLFIPPSSFLLACNTNQLLNRERKGPSVLVSTSTMIEANLILQRASFSL